jgi:fructokinase
MANQKRPVIVGLGEVLWDVFPDGAKFGGAPANFACHAAAMGTESHVVSAVGNDELGRKALDSLKHHNVGTEAVAQIDDRPTGNVMVTLDGSGHPSYEITEDTAWDAIPCSDAALALAGRADAVCFGSLAQRSPVTCSTIGQFLSRTRPRCLSVFDANLRQAYYSLKIIDQSLRAASVLKLNEDELPELAKLLKLDPTDTPESLLAQLQDRFTLKLIALTLGPEGSILLDSFGQLSRCDAMPVEVQDTVGAGDAFTAAMIAGLLADRPLDKINRHASQVGAYVCTQSGATPKLPKELLGIL